MSVGEYRIQQAGTGSTGLNPRPVEPSPPSQLQIDKFELMKRLDANGTDHAPSFPGFRKFLPLATNRTGYGFFHKTRKAHTQINTGFPVSL